MMTKKIIQIATPTIITTKIKNLKPQNPHPKQNQKQSPHPRQQATKTKAATTKCKSKRKSKEKEEKESKIDYSSDVSSVSDSEDEDDDYYYNNNPKWSCNQIRGKIRKMLNDPNFKITHWLREIGVNSNSYGRFMKLKGAWNGTQNSTYWAAIRYFRKQEKIQAKKK